MKTSHQHQRALGLAILSVGLAGGLLWSHQSLAAEVVPPTYDTHGTVPGDPRNAQEDLAKLYKAIKVFRARHGRYPVNPVELNNDAAVRLRAYGLKKASEFRPVLINPDSRYSDSSVARKQPNDFIPYQMRAKRLDGTAIGSAKALATRDALAWTSLYYHRNIRSTQDENGQTIVTSQPVGFFVVLWDDGSIEQVPYDQQLYAPVGKNTWQTAFPGEAGLPAKTLTYAQFQTIGT